MRREYAIVVGSEGVAPRFGQAAIPNDKTTTGSSDRLFIAPPEGYRW